MIATIVKQKEYEKYEIKETESKKGGKKQLSSSKKKPIITRPSQISST